METDKWTDRQTRQTHFKADRWTIRKKTPEYKETFSLLFT